jgi:hypothetical protein
MILGDDQSSVSTEQQQQRQVPPSPMDSKNPQYYQTPSSPTSPLAGPSPPAYHHSRQALYSHYPPPPPVHRESAGRRFLKGFGIALIIWFLLGMFTHSVVEVAHKHPYMLVSVAIANSSRNFDGLNARIPLLPLPPYRMDPLVQRLVMGSVTTASMAMTGFGMETIHQKTSRTGTIPSTPSSPSPSMPPHSTSSPAARGPSALLKLSQARMLKTWSST